MLNAEQLAAFRAALLRWHRRHALDAPWRESRDPYHALVAAVMAQQTQMSRVLPKYREFISAFPTVEALAAATAGDVLRVWAPLGYNMRALRLRKAARRIARDGFPRTAEELAQIDGIGPFTAAIVSSFAFGEPAAAIDTNVRRIVERLNGMQNGATYDSANALLSRRAPARWNQAMMDLGALVCTTRDPSCGECPLAKWCVFCANSSLRRPGFSLAKHDRDTRVAERRASYRAEPPFKRSRRYYRGRIVQALRDLPRGRSIPIPTLHRELHRAEACPSKGEFAGLLASLQRDGLIRLSKARVRLP